MMRFPPILSAWLGKLTNRGKVLVAHVFPTGTVARFVFEKKRKLYGDWRPRPLAFEPNRNDAKGVFETSICGLMGVTNERLWFLGDNIREKPAIAAVEIAVVEIVKAGLNCVSEPSTDPIDFPEHGVILGWHETDKSERLAKMQALAAAYKATLRPSSGS